MDHAEATEPDKDTILSFVLYDPPLTADQLPAASACVTELRHPSPDGRVLHYYANEHGTACNYSMGEQDLYSVRMATVQRDDGRTAAVYATGLTEEDALLMLALVPELAEQAGVDGDADEEALESADESEPEGALRFQDLDAAPEDEQALLSALLDDEAVNEITETEDDEAPPVSFKDLPDDPLDDVPDVSFEPTYRAAAG